MASVRVNPRKLKVGVRVVVHPHLPQYSVAGVIVKSPHGFERPGYRWFLGDGADRPRYAHVQSIEMEVRDARPPAP